MIRKYTSLSFLIIASSILAVFILLRGNSNPVELVHNKIKHTHTPKVHSDTITACIFYHAADYFVYQGSVIGFQYDILKQMGNDLQRPVEISIATDSDDMLSKALSGQFDAVCFDFDMGNFIGTYIDVSEPIAFTYPVLIMRKHSKSDTILRKEINSSEGYFNTLDLSDLEDSGDWKIVNNPDLTIEDLMELLVDKQIDYAVCNYNVAITLMPFYKQLSIGPRIGDNFARKWILNVENVELNKTINDWLRGFKETNKYQALCRKYLSPDSYVISRSFGKQKHSTSQYDNILKKASGHYGFDWHLMSSIIYQESRFIPDLVGFGGSYGIMQMMPVTCQRYGITDTSSVEDQIWAGAKYISFLCNIFRGKVDSTQLYYFVSGSYNSGPGHILDAMALCEKYGHDNTKWQNVVEYLILKSHKDYYSDEVVKCGYYPGKHTANYVDQVMTRYNGYILAKE